MRQTDPLLTAQGGKFQQLWANLRQIMLRFWWLFCYIWPRAQTTQTLIGLCILFTSSFAGIVFLLSIGNLRDNYLRDRVAGAYTAALVFEATSTNEMIDETLTREILDSVTAYTLAMKINNTRHLLAISAMPPMAEEAYDLRDTSLFGSIRGALGCLFAPHARVLKITGAAPMGGDFLEVTLNEAPLRHMLRHHAFGLFITAALGAMVAAIILAGSLAVFILKPLQRLTANIIAFGEMPENTANFIAPSDRHTEIGAAESALLTMQKNLAMQLIERRRLAQLGLAVAKINHDLRNLLSAAQLFLDRLSGLDDKTVQTLSHKLMHTLDRAISFCEATLSYGKATEVLPKPEYCQLLPLVDEVLDLLRANEIASNIAQINTSANPLLHSQSPNIFVCIAPTITVYADREQLFRALLNLTKNSFEILHHATLPHGQNMPRQILLGAALDETQERFPITIHIIDSGPGIPEAMRPKLFTPFLGSNRAGSTGLGLAIAHELISAQHGTLTLRNPQEETLPEALHTAWQNGHLQDTPKIGAWFCITLPATHAL